MLKVVPEITCSPVESPIRPEAATPGWTYEQAFRPEKPVLPEGVVPTDRSADERDYLQEAFAMARGESLVPERAHIEALIEYAASLENLTQMLEADFRPSELLAMRQAFDRTAREGVTA